MSDEKTFQEAVQAVSQGQRVRARDIFTRLLKKDPNNPEYWLWLSAVVEDSEKVQCMERVLSINPENVWARKKLKLLHQKLGVVTPSRGTVLLTEIPLDVLQIRAERQVIIEQWQAFMSIIDHVAPKMAYEQAAAFLRGLARANDQAVERLFAVAALRDEMEQQWRELDAVGRSLGQAMRRFAHRPADEENDLSMRQVLQRLFEELMARRRGMKKQVELYGGKIE